MIAKIINAENIEFQDTQVDYVLGENVIFLLLQDGTARLLDLNGEFCAVTVNGASILLDTLHNGSLTAADQIVSEYGIELEQALNDVQIFLQDLERRKFIEYSDVISKLKCSRNKHLEFNAKFLIQLLLRIIHFFPISLQTKAWIALGLSYFSLRLFGLPKTVKAWSISHSHKQEITGSLEEIDVAVRKAIAHHFLNVQCKERALCCWWLASLSGISTRLVLGIGLFPLTSHFWCEAGKKKLADDSDRCKMFTPVFTYE